MKKRKIKWGRIAILSIPVILILGLGVWVLVGRDEKTEPVQEPKAEIKQETKVKTVRITATGDILLEDAILNYFGDGDWKGYMDELAPVFAADDLTIANQEVPIAGEAFGITGIDYSFNSPDITADNVKAQGIDFVTLANNHAMDRGQEGLNATIANLDRVGLEHTGAFDSEEGAAQPKIIEKDGIKIGITSWTYGTNIPTETAWSVNVFPGREEELLEQVRQLDENCDAVIVCMHWGTEFTYNLNEVQVTLSQQIADAGADVIIGNHPHTIQPATWLDGKDGKVLCFYSLGNLVSSAYTVSRADEQFQNMYEIGAVGQFSFVKEKDGTVSVTDPLLIPYVNHFQDEYQNFRLIKLKDYTEELAQVHDQRRFSELFTADWLKSQVHQVFDSSGIEIEMD